MQTVFDSSSPLSLASHTICKQMMQEGKVGATIHKNPITSEQLQQVYETGQLGEWDTLDPSQLLRTAWFYITFYFGKRGRENQRKLTSDMLFLRSTPSGRRYYEFRSLFASKNHQGGLTDNPDESDGKMFEVPNSKCFNNQEKCLQSSSHKKCGTAIPP